MPSTLRECEPYQLSARFYRAMQARALTLEIDALGDELVAAQMEEPDQIRRQRLLVQAQRQEARRLRKFLRLAAIRPATHLDPTR